MREDGGQWGGGKEEGARSAYEPSPAMKRGTVSEDAGDRGDLLCLLRGTPAAELGQEGGAAAGI
jgi:hypothetical protein